RPACGPPPYRHEAEHADPEPEGDLPGRRRRPPHDRSPARTHRHVRPARIGVLKQRRAAERADEGADHTPHHRDRNAHHCPHHPTDQPPPTSTARAPPTAGGTDAHHALEQPT